MSATFNIFQDNISILYYLFYRAEAKAVMIQLLEEGENDIEETEEVREEEMDKD